jgi:hypothetical protein
MNKTSTFHEHLDSRAWLDTDDDTWHEEHLWMEGNGRRVRYTICDSDGNHEPCSKREADLFINESPDSWKEYNRYVAETGDDPLHNFLVTRTIKKRRKFIVYLAPWIGMSTHGVAVTSARFGGKVCEPKDFPKWLNDFCMVKKTGSRYYLDGITDPDKDLQDVGGYLGKWKSGWYFKGAAEWTEPRNPAALKRELKKKATAALSTTK